MEAKDRNQIEQALENHERLKSSYFWTDLGNASARRNQEKKYNFSVSVEHEGDIYEYTSSVRISTKNFYYHGRFTKNGKRGDVRLFKKLLR